MSWGMYVAGISQGKQEGQGDCSTVGIRENGERLGQNGRWRPGYKVPWGGCIALRMRWQAMGSLSKEGTWYSLHLAGGPMRMKDTVRKTP